MLNWPNRITLFRIFSIPLFVFLLLEHKERYNSQNIENLNELRWAAFGVFVLAVISDGLDGMIARLKQQKTLLGTILDPVADKLLL
ncbi:CDP-alcohol phosphatidyltransferase family protein, partial [Arthrospira platensis SPKY1]|nr:CDP-alcohol phosphatidyltransferase family protein [Arthrospira platensis SPKY1]